MDTITINRSKSNNIEFNMKIDGALVDDAQARFVIHFDQYKLCFDCTYVSQETFSVTIPTLPLLTKGVQECSIEVIVNGQIFRPLRGNVTIVDDVKVSVDVSNQPQQPPTQKPEENEEKKDMVNRVGEPIARPAEPTNPFDTFNITKYLQNRNAAEEEETVKEGMKDKKVREILESLNIPVSKPKKRTSLKSIAETKRKSKSVN